MGAHQNVKAKNAFELPITALNPNRKKSEYFCSKNKIEVKLRRFAKRTHIKPHTY